MYRPAATSPIRQINEKFAHKLQFLDETGEVVRKGSVPKGHEGIVVGDLNIAPLEHDVWSHKDLLKVVSHTPIETAGPARAAEGGQMGRPHAPARAGRQEALYMVELPRAGLGGCRPRPPARPYLDDTGPGARTARNSRILKEARGWTSSLPTTCRSWRGLRCESARPQSAEAPRLIESRRAGRTDRRSTPSSFRASAAKTVAPNSGYSLATPHEEARGRCAMPCKGSLAVAVIVARKAAANHRHFAQHGPGPGRTDRRVARQSRCRPVRSASERPRHS